MHVIQRQLNRQSMQIAIKSIKSSASQPENPN